MRERGDARKGNCSKRLYRRNEKGQWRTEVDICSLENETTETIIHHVLKCGLWGWIGHEAN